MEYCRVCVDVVAVVVIVVVPADVVEVVFFEHPANISKAEIVKMEIER